MWTAAVDRLAQAITALAVKGQLGAVQPWRSASLQKSAPDQTLYGRPSQLQPRGGARATVRPTIGLGEPCAYGLTSTAVLWHCVPSRAGARVHGRAGQSSGIALCLCGPAVLASVLRRKELARSLGYVVIAPASRGSVLSATGSCAVCGL